MKLMMVAAGAALLAGGAIVTTAMAMEKGKAKVKYGVKYKPQWTENGELKQPEDFRRLVYLGSPLTPNALNGGAAGFPEYHNVYVQPKAFESFRKTGEWPEGTMMIKELQLVKSDDTNFEDGSRFEVSGRGYFPSTPNGMDVSVKDSARFSDTNGWGYFNFGHKAPPYAASAAAAPKDACAQCHIDNADYDMTFVNFYRPILDPLPKP